MSIHHAACLPIKPRSGHLQAMLIIRKAECALRCHRRASGIHLHDRAKALAAARILLVEWSAELMWCSWRRRRQMWKAGRRR